MGRPKGSTSTKLWAEALRRAALERVKTHGNARKLDIAAKAMVDKLTSGDTSIMREFGDRIDGRVPTPIVGEDNGPIAVTIRQFGKVSG